ncbi:MAG: ferredoxin [Candidatus Omnitrophica bacterium]|nr:ferredoxin [Candidatus Omnitrophota bacterium]
MGESRKEMNRRSLLQDALRSAGLLGMGGAFGFLIGRAQAQQYCWQIDPYKCIACGNCATYCVLEESAVKCVNTFEMCGYCKLCTAFFDPAPQALNTGAENQLCPTGAIIRTFLEDPYYEYKIDESLCIGCGKCVVGCKAFGNGSLYLQVRHDRCLNCNECAIAVACPSEAFIRTPVENPYRLKGKNHSA